MVTTKVAVTPLPSCAVAVMVVVFSSRTFLALTTPFWVTVAALVSELSHTSLSSDTFSGVKIASRRVQPPDFTLLFPVMVSPVAKLFTTTVTVARSRLPSVVFAVMVTFPILC